MEQGSQPGTLRSARVLIIGLLTVLIVPGLALIFAAISAATNPAAPSAEEAQRDALANSSNECVTCHRQTTPGIVEQYSRSTMAVSVTCQNCHEVRADYPGAIEHEGTYVLNQPTTAMCQTCHQGETAQYLQSRHALPAYVAMVGTDDLSEEQMTQYQSIPEAALGPNQTRAALFNIEGPEITRFACAACHNIGRPALDGSVGECQQCHLRHEFSLEQARRPETCNACHIGPDHPQWEIYQESPHGIAYATGGDSWNWDAEPGTLTVNDFPAPTCATCHFSGFGASGTTHDAGDRLSWYLFAQFSERRPNYQENITAMQNVCFECHNRNFITTFYADADVAVEYVNGLVTQGTELLQPLREQNLLTATPFDESVEFTYYELWHHWGRTAKFGVWMLGADYVQWHGVYEMLGDLTDIREFVAEAIGAPESAAVPGG
ncbi:MAG: nitrate reductase [Chloroflexi bacterium]|nr:nitrate reductase [Chloroflexota bacterium]